MILTIAVKTDAKRQRKEQHLTSNNNAILLACDRGYFPFAMYLFWQIRLTHPAPSFDFVLASMDDLAIPSQLEWLNIRQVRIPESVVPPVYEEIGMPIGYFLKMFAIEHLAEDYHRVLFLDADIVFEGGDLERLIGLDLSGKVFGAALDIWHYHIPNYISREFRALEYPSIPYFNTGVLLVDTSAWRDQQISERCADFSRRHPKVLVLHDQSALNCVLLGDFAEISPAWNWMPNSQFRYVTYRFPVFFRHFGGKTQKPWNDSFGRQDVRFVESYRSFFANWWPEMQSLVMAPRAVELLTLRELARSSYEQIKFRKTLHETLRKYKDPFKVFPGSRARV